MPSNQLGRMLRLEELKGAYNIPKHLINGVQDILELRFTLCPSSDLL